MKKKTLAVNSLCPVDGLRNTMHWRNCKSHGSFADFRCQSIGAIKTGLALLRFLAGQRLTNCAIAALLFYSTSLTNRRTQHRNTERQYTVTNTVSVKRQRKVYR